MIAPAERPGQQASPPLAAGKDQIEVQVRNGLPVDSMAVTKEGLAAAMGSLMASPDSPAKPISSTQSGDDEYRLADEDEAGAPMAPPIQILGSHAQAWEPESGPHIPSSQWTSEATNRTRQYLLVGFLGVSGIALAALLFIGFLRWYATEQSSPSQALQPLQPERATDNVASNLDSVEDIPLASPNPNLDGPHQAPLEPTTIDAGNDNVLVTNPPVDPNLVARDLEPTLESNPSEGSNSVDSTATDTEPNNPTATQPSLPKQIAAFAPMLNVEIQPQFPDAIEILSEAPVTAEDLGLTSSAGLPEIPAIEYTTQAQIPISGLIVPALPISQFVSLWSNVSGIPTVVDLDSLAAAAIDRNQSLALEMVQSATVGSIVPQLGKELGLKAEPQENRYLKLHAPSELIEQKLPRSVALDGLIADDAGERWLTQALDELLPDHSVTWTIADGQLQRPELEGNNPLDSLAWYSAVKLIEGWRLAKGEASTLSQYAATQLSAEFISPSEVTGLDAVLQQATPQSRPVAQVLPRICREAGVEAWIDWANVGAIGLGPQSTAVFVTAARPLRRALADYASEFSLVVAVLDSQSLLFTSNQAYRSSPQLYVLPSDGRTADEWKSQLRPFTPAADGGVGVGSVVVIPTPDEKFMLVRCCRPVVSF